MVRIHSPRPILSIAYTLRLSEKVVGSLETLALKSSSSGTMASIWRVQTTVPTANPDLFEMMNRLGILRALQLHLLYPRTERRWFHAEDRGRSVGAVNLPLTLFDGFHEVLALATFDLFSGQH